MPRKTTPHLTSSITILSIGIPKQACSTMIYSHAPHLLATLNNTAPGLFTRVGQTNRHSTLLHSSSTARWFDSAVKRRARTLPQPQAKRQAHLTTPLFIRYNKSSVLDKK